MLPPPANSQTPSVAEGAALAEAGAAIAVWARVMRLLRRMMLAMLALVALAVVALWRHRGMVPVRFAIGAALGMVLGAGLLGGWMLLIQRRRNRHCHRRGPPATPRRED